MGAVVLAAVVAVPALLVGKAVDAREHLALEQLERGPAARRHERDLVLHPGVGRGGRRVLSTATAPQKHPKIPTKKGNPTPGKGAVSSMASTSISARIEPDAKNSTAHGAAGRQGGGRNADNPREKITRVRIVKPKPRLRPPTHSTPTQHTATPKYSTPTQHGQDQAQAKSTPPPIMPMPPEACSFATESRMALVPLEKLGNSKTPAGPFQTTVLAYREVEVEGRKKARA